MNEWICKAFDILKIFGDFNADKEENGIQGRRRGGGSKARPVHKVLGGKIIKSLKVSRSQNKIVEPKLLPKMKQTNLFFYPDEIKNTWNLKF